MRALKRAVIEALANDDAVRTLAPGGVHHLLAPRQDGVPALIYASGGSVPTWGLRQIHHEVYEVHILAAVQGPAKDTSQEDLEDALAAVRAVLNGADDRGTTLILDDGSRWICRYAGELPDYAEADQTQKYIRLGHRYTIASGGV
jgi:hypothetical protein